MYIQYIQGFFHSKLGTADYAPVTSSFFLNYVRNKNNSSVY
jgi:hypothetical protein